MHAFGSVLRVTQPRRRPVEEVGAHRMAAVEHVAEQILVTDEDAGEGHLDLADDADGAVGAVGDCCERIDGGDLEG